jgi:hypothetical protein
MIVMGYDQMEQRGPFCFLAAHVFRPSHHRRGQHLYAAPFIVPATRKLPF